MKTSLIPLFTAVLYAIAGVHAQVQVGSGGAFRFNPETITASVGSMVNFTIVGQIHTVTESTSKLNGPCTTGAGGFDSGPTHGKFLTRWKKLP
jgi:plastocyanin